MFLADIFICNESPGSLRLVIRTFQIVDEAMEQQQEEAQKRAQKRAEKNKKKPNQRDKDNQ